MELELRPEDVERLVAMGRKFAREGLTFDDVLLAGFLAARHAGRSNEEALRAAVAAGAASTLEVGAGRFDPRHAGRLQAGVELAELAPVEA